MAEHTNKLPNEVWYDADTWNWNPTCAPKPARWAIANETITGGLITTLLPCDPTDSACAVLPYHLSWEIDEIITLVWPAFLYVLGVLYTFFGIAIICDEFFVPALERICDKYKISPDVAGATLMAAGGSAPELATSFISTLNESPVGFGTIVGSAVFNVLFVIGACAFAAPSELHLDWWPLFRDSSFYCVSLLVLTVFFGYLTPSQMYWYEALILFFMYILYVIMMSKNAQLEACVMRCAKKCSKKKPNTQKKKNSEIAVHPAPDEMTKDDDDSTKKLVETEKEESEAQVVKVGDNGDGAGQVVKVEGSGGEAVLEKQDSGDDGDDDDDDEGPLDMDWPTKDAFHHHPKCATCKLIVARIMYLVFFPLKLLFLITVPDVRREDGTCCAFCKCCRCKVKWKETWFPAFTLSILWIIFFSYLMVWWAEVLGKVSGMHPSFIGLTLLAAGTSIPDLVSSVLVARKGEGNMAVSSSIGSNIFDILVGLPIPWLVYSFYTGARSWGACTNKLTGTLEDDSYCFFVGVYADTLLFSVTLLIFMIVVVILIVHCSGWKMTKGLGIGMLILYFIFVIQDVLRQCDMVPETARWFTFLSSNQ